MGSKWIPLNSCTLSRNSKKRMIKIRMQIEKHIAYWTCLELQSSESEPSFAVSIEYRYIVTTLAVIGKACIISTFLGIYVFTVELYPTVIRNTGMGVCSTMARIGSIISPYIVLLVCICISRFSNDCRKKQYQSNYSTPNNLNRRTQRYQPIRILSNCL